MNNTDMIKYLERIIKLEIKCNEQKGLMKAIQVSKKNLKPPKEEKLLYEEFDYNRTLLENLGLGLAAFVVIAIVLLIISGVIYVIRFMFGNASFPKLFFLISNITSFIIIVILSIHFTEDTKIEREKNYKKNLTIRTNNNEITQAYKNKIQRCDNEYSNIKQEYDNTQSVLLKYYNIGIIYPKYRNLFCIGLIYEYYNSGICDTLIGPYGAYAKVEQDLKYYKVSDQLDRMESGINTIVGILNNMELKQSMIYNAIIKADHNIAVMSDTINSNLKKITGKIDEVNHHLTSTEYTNKINKMNIELLRDIEIYKHLK